jgi:hypothetical protein
MEYTNINEEISEYYYNNKYVIPRIYTKINELGTITEINNFKNIEKKDLWFSLLQRLMAIQKVKLYLPGQLDTMEVQEDYLLRLDETRTKIINLIGELGISIHNEDIVFTNRIDL